MKIGSRILAVLGIAAVSAFSGAALAQQAYPNKPIRLIVPLPPGGSSDTMARVMAEFAEPLLGQKFVIENISAGSGTVAGRTLATAPKDGYTLLMGLAQINAANYAMLKDPGYKPSDFAPVINLGAGAYVLTVLKDSPVQSVKDLVDLAKKQPGKLNFGSGGTGTSSHLVSELFRIETKTDMVHIPYPGGGPMMTAFLGHQLDMVLGTETTVMGQVRSGALRALAVTTPTRMEEMPNVPTMAEAGYPGVKLDSWLGLFAPAGTPPAVIDKLHATVKTALSTPAAGAKLKTIGIRPDFSGPKEFGDYVSSEIVKYRDLIKAIGLETQ